MTNLVQLLRTLRETRGLSLRELAPQVGVSFASLNGYELETIDPPLSRFTDWAAALGMAVAVVNADGSPLEEDKLTEDQRALLQTVLELVPRLSDTEARVIRMQIAGLVASREDGV